jgi:site-specific DNA-methyltransferase (adenine-specific)
MSSSARDLDRSNPRVTIYQGDNLPIMEGWADSSFDFVYVDPPFNTGRSQVAERTRSVRDAEQGTKTGFRGERYRREVVDASSFQDDFDDYLAFLRPRLEHAHRLLDARGSLFLHIDYRESHYCKVLLDRIFGRDRFMNEIVWAYDFGARSRRRWSTKHDTLLWYVKDPRHYTFHFEEMERIPYMAPGLVGPDKAARGKTPTDVWWHTIVPTSGSERTGYPTQKPLGLINRILKVHTSPGDRVLDFFAGSGTTGESAARLGRACTLIDENPEAIRVMTGRLAFARPDVVVT